MCSLVRLHGQSIHMVLNPVGDRVIVHTASASSFVGHVLRVDSSRRKARLCSHF